jgi:citrate lyase alpha subunit
MTGGLHGIAERAQKWNEKAIEGNNITVSALTQHSIDMKKQRKKILDELAEVGRSLRSIEQEQQIASQITGLESRIKYSKQDVTMTEDRISRATKEIKAVDADMKKQQTELDKVI